MQELPIGEVVRNRRKELRLTQEMVCSGICEPMTLSRIENGKQSPSYNRVKAILQRLALPEDRYVALLKEDELRLEALKKEVDARTILVENCSAPDRSKRREEALRTLRELEDFAGEDQLTRQFILGQKVSLGKADVPYSLDEKLDLLTEAIRITCPRFNLEDINDFLYSRTEMGLIVRIANAYALAGERWKAMNLYSQLLRYTRKHGWNQPRYAEQLVMILTNYARELNLDKRYGDSIELARLGWSIAIKYKVGSCLGTLPSVQANSYGCLGEKEKAKDFYLQAFYLYKAFGDLSGLFHLKNDALATLGMELN